MHKKARKSRMAQKFSNVACSGGFGDVSPVGAISRSIRSTVLNPLGSFFPLRPLSPWYSCSFSGVSLKVRLPDWITSESGVKDDQVLHDFLAADEFGFGDLDDLVALALGQHREVL